MMALLQPGVENVLFGNVAVGTMSWYGDDVLGTHVLMPLLIFEHTSKCQQSLDKRSKQFELHKQSKKEDKAQFCVMKNHRVYSIKLGHIWAKPI